MSIAAEHPLVATGITEARRSPLVCAKEDKIKRSAEHYEKEGVDTGLRAHHPATGEEVPIFVANFVLMDYGTGAVMAVPAHDQRDFEFATKYGLSIQRIVIQPDGVALDSASMETAYTGAGKMVNSGNFRRFGKRSRQKGGHAAPGGKGLGRANRLVSSLRDWLLSRQRYWGCPIRGPVRDARLSAGARERSAGDACPTT